MGFREQAGQLERIQALAVLEERYEKAKDAYREHKTPKKREEFQEAKNKFAEARAQYREEEVAAGRRTVGASVSSKGETE